jgi:serine/threonine protein kinase
VAEHASALDGPSSAEPIEVGDLVAGKYRVHALLGHGGMGRVFSATNEATGKSVALKYVLDPSSAGAAARFAREARAAGRIHHPNVVDIYDTVEHHGATCIVMELLRGEALSSRLARERTLPVDDAIAIAIEIAQGIAAAHRVGVIHRDLKPANLFLVDADGRLRLKVLDFGISKIIESDPQLVTNTGVVLGTPHYLSPEQVRGVTDVDERVDVYAMGAVLYEMLVGRPPHDHTHVPALLVDIATVIPAAPHLLRPEIPRELSDIVMRALSKDASKRFASADAFAEALADLGRSPAERRPSSRDAVPRDAIELQPTLEAISLAPTTQSTAAPSRRRTAALALALLGSVGLAAAAWAWTTQSPPAPATPPATPPATSPVTSAPPSPAAESEPDESEPLAGSTPPPQAPPISPTTTADTPATSADAPSSAQSGETPSRRQARSPREPREEAVREASPRTATDEPEAPPSTAPPTTSSTEPTPREPRAGRLGLDDL